VRHNRQGKVIVEKGLAAGERIVTDGQLRLVPGAKVQIKAGSGGAGCPRAESGKGE